MLFRKHIDPRCVYCYHGTPLDEHEIGCMRHGVVNAYWHCRKFKYDPLKRMPPPPVVLSKRYTAEDFAIDHET